MKIRELPNILKGRNKIVCHEAFHSLFRFAVFGLAPAMVNRQNWDFSPYQETFHCLFRFGVFGLAPAMVGHQKIGKIQVNKLVPAEQDENHNNKKL